MAKFQSTWPFYCLHWMFDFAAICRGRTSFGGHRLLSKTHFECYLSWPEVLLKVIDCLRCLILMLFVVFQSIWLPSMLDLDAICRGRRYFYKSIAFLRCLIFSLLVVAGHTFGGHCFSWMLDFDAICRGRKHFWILLFAFDA